MLFDNITWIFSWSLRHILCHNAAFDILMRNDKDALKYVQVLWFWSCLFYSKYDRFCPYAYKKNNTVRAHDISIYYNYLANTTEWYNTLKVKTWNNVTMVSDGIMYRFVLDDLTAYICVLFVCLINNWVEWYFLLV